MSQSSTSAGGNADPEGSAFIDIDDIPDQVASEVSSASGRTLVPDLTEDGVEIKREHPSPEVPSPDSYDGHSNGEQDSTGAEFILSHEEEESLPDIDFQDLSTIIDYQQPKDLNPTLVPESGHETDLREHQMSRKRHSYGLEEPGETHRNKRSRLPPSGPSDGPNLLESLFHQDVIKDAQNNIGRPDLVVDSTKDKRNLLASYTRNVPKEEKAQARIDKNLLYRASVDLLKTKIKADGEGGWKIDGMVSSLTNHQLIGAHFMKKREMQPVAPFGGMECDTMGLGKTITTIATVHCHRPAKTERNRCTLIVCPSIQLVNQWESELIKHAPSAFNRILRHCSGSRMSGVGTENVLREADIVLTTYSEVVKSYPKIPLPDDINSEKDLIRWWNHRDDLARDVLHSVQWYRVVLDEASALKNYKSGTSIACRALMGKYRWALTGTPIMNSKSDIDSGV